MQKTINEQEPVIKDGKIVSPGQIIINNKVLTLERGIDANLPDGDKWVLTGKSSRVQFTLNGSITIFSMDLREPNLKPPEKIFKDSEFPAALKWLSERTGRTVGVTPYLSRGWLEEMYGPAHPVGSEKQNAKLLRLASQAAE